MNYLSQSWRIDRRHALRAMGTCISLPLLECMVPLRAAEQATASPRRSAFIYLANGVHSLNYQILPAGKDYQFSQSLKPLEKHREVITPSAACTIREPRASSQLHHSLPDRRKTRPFDPQYHLRGPEDGRNHRATDPLPLHGDRPHAGFPRLDRRRRPACPRCVVAARSSLPVSRNRKAAIAAQRKPCAQRPASSMTTSPKCVGWRKRWEPRTKAASTNTSPPFVKRRFVRGGPMTGSTPRFPRSQTLIANATNRDIPKTQAGDYFRTVYDLMVLAFQTDVTRVATFSLGGEGRRLLHSRNRHHRIPPPAQPSRRRPGYMEKLTNYDTFAIEQFSYFLTRLAETKDLNGKPLLGSTMALFGSGMCYGHSHGNANLPLVLAGGTGPRPETRQPSRLQPSGSFDGYSTSDGALTSDALPDLRPPREQRRPHEQPASPHGPADGVETDHFGDRIAIVMRSWSVPGIDS